MLGSLWSFRARSIRVVSRGKRKPNQRGRQCDDSPCRRRQFQPGVWADPKSRIRRLRRRSRRGRPTRAAREPTDPDLIVLDLMLPGIDGYTILKKLRAEGKDDARADSDSAR